MNAGGPDFRLDGLRPADIASGLAEDGMSITDLTVLAEHHTDGNPPTSYLVAHDGSATWGPPGTPQLAAIKITRDPDRRTFTFETAPHAGLAFAQHWLVERGCPPEPIPQVAADIVQPADNLTLHIEQQIRGSGDRYEVLDNWAWDGDDSCETWTMVRDSRALQAPIRVFLEDVDLASFAYTVREGAFADRAAALHWLDHRDAPLPLPPEHRGDTTALRTRAALTRSAGSSPRPTEAPGPDTATGPTPDTHQQAYSRRMP